MRGIRSMLGVGMVLAAMCGAGGCRTLPRSAGYDLTISVSDSLTDVSGSPATVEVHVIALDFVKAKVLQDASMSDYWDPNRRRRDFTMRVMRFGAGQPTTQTLAWSDPIWADWQRAGASYLFVLADLPNVFKDLPDIKDPRRLILPLDRARWQHRAIQIAVEADGVFCLTPRLPPKP